VRGGAAALGLLLLGACGGGSGGPAPWPPPPEAVLPPDWLQPFLDRALEEGRQHGLPGPEARELQETADLLDAAAVGGRIGRAARADLREQPPLRLAAALLALLEDRETPVALRRQALALLAEDGPAAAVPRLVLRLKYEKDWTANVDLVRALWRHGNGAGLEALVNILQSTDPAFEEARLRAAGALAELPGLPPEATGFEERWRHLLDLRERWLGERRLLPDARERWPATEGGEDPDYRQELWRILARLRSQPLRPVDDARYVLSRVSLSVLPLLLQAARDPDLYVREHALQVLSWLGPAAGHGLRRQGRDWEAFVRAALGDARARPRVLEAAGAPGLAEAAPWILPWLVHGDAEERTAAADALLRCADPDPGLLEVLRRVHAGEAGPLSPEAAWSLILLRLEIDPGWRPPEGLAESERRRRERWRAERSLRPAPAGEAGDGP